MKVFCGTYAAYNSGSLKGAWLDLEGYVDSEDFLKACAKLHEDEEDPEFMFQDEEDVPSCFFSESCINPDLWTMIDEADDLEEAAAFLVYYNEWNKQTFEDARRGKWDSDEAFVEALVRDLDTIPEFLEAYIDWERMAKDYMMDYTSSDGYYFECL